MNGAFLELRLSKVLVVDDHTLIREAMRDVLSELDPGCVVLEAHDGAGALDLAERNRDMDLVLLDLTLPDIDGLTVLADLRGRYPTTAVVVLSGVKDRDTVTKAVGLGAVGYIPKSTTHEIMVNALRLVCSGGVYLPPEVMGRGALKAGAQGSCDPAREFAAESARATAASLGLTDRQAQILSLIAQGKANKTICRELGLAEATVKNHVTSILKALNLTNRTQAAIWAAKMDWGPHQVT
jgi:DNA-binding NarL/FixJ family response regulator